MRRAFSMIEIVIVVLIIGLLAAIAIPRFSMGAMNSRELAMFQNLRILRNAFEVFSAEHGQRYPAFRGDGANAAHTEAAFLTQLLNFSDVRGNTNATRDAAHPFGPYLRRRIPAQTFGPHVDETAVKILTGTTAPVYDAAGNYGWIYNDTSGEIIPNMPNGEKAIVSEKLIYSRSK